MNWDDFRGGGGGGGGEEDTKPADTHARGLGGSSKVHATGTVSDCRLSVAA